jgi:hypothetical protein
MASIIQSKGINLGNGLLSSEMGRGVNKREDKGRNRGVNKTETEG